MSSSRKKPARKKTADRSEDLMVLHQLGQHVEYEILEDSEATIKLPSNPRGLFILSVYWNCKTKNNDPDYEPEISEVWATIEIIYDAEPKHYLIERMGTSQIWWRGRDQPMTRARVANLLSDFRKSSEKSIQEALEKFNQRDQP